MGELSKEQWEILNNVADDWECLGTMDLPHTSRALVVDDLEKLYEGGLIYVKDGLQFDRQALLEEPEEYSEQSYWFGLTELGCNEWEAHSKEYCGSPVDWSESWAGLLSFEGDRCGYIEGESERVCLRELERLLPRGPYVIDSKSLKHSQISGFKAKYCKHISGGHRIDFRVKRSLRRLIWIWTKALFHKKREWILTEEHVERLMGM